MRTSAFGLPASMASVCRCEAKSGAPAPSYPAAEKPPSSLQGEDAKRLD
jgi:hypothetical protein